MNTKRLPALVVGILALVIVGTVTGLVFALGYQLNPLLLLGGTLAYFVAAGYAGWREGRKHHAQQTPPTA